MSLLSQLLLVPLLIAMNAFFVAAEYAVVSLRPGQIHRLRSSGRLRVVNAIQRLQAEPASAIGAIQVCITMTNLLLGWIAEPAMSALLGQLFEPVIKLAPSVLSAVSVGLGFLIVTLLTVVLSELLPKALTLRYAPAAAILTAVPILAIRTFVRPLVWLMNGMANVITRPLGLGKVDDMDEQRLTIDELQIMVTQAADQGILTPRSRTLALNALALGRRKAKQIMIPRVQVDYMDLRWSMQKNYDVVQQHLFTRLPLCDGGLDHVVGVVNVKQFLTAYKADGDTTVLRLLATPPVYAPETATPDRLLAQFGEKQTDMLFLVDEFGGVEGIVTLRDVVSELIGELPQPA